MIALFILGILFVPLAIYGAALAFLAVPFVALWQRGGVGNLYQRLSPGTRKTVWQSALLAASLLVWIYVFKGLE